MPLNPRLLRPLLTRERLADIVPPAGAWSFRRLRRAYSGACCRIRRTSDNAEIDVGFAGDAVDAAAISSHCSGTDGRVVTWYDQMGGGTDFNLSQTTGANQPTICTSGAVETQNNRVTMKLGSNDTLRASSTGLDIFRNVSYGAMLSVSRNTVTNARRDIAAWLTDISGFSRISHLNGLVTFNRISFSARRLDADASVVLTHSVNSPNSLALFAHYRDFASGVADGFVNGASIGAQTGLATGNTSDTRSFLAGVGRVFLAAPVENISELAVYNTNVTAFLPRLQYDVMAYYGL
jgi:hypothetical protein